MPRLQKLEEDVYQDIELARTLIERIKAMPEELGNYYATKEQILEWLAAFCEMRETDYWDEVEKRSFRKTTR